ncbi:MAG: signal recognition particle protein [Alphaproteobacteria bacterium]|jgi:signal recognition particle subunit SRP54|nr:signal recognition particle protein [Candidatus Jidaibacter sp.]
MFTNLTTSLGKVFDKLRGKGFITAADVDDALREIRVALFEADVALPVVKELVTKIKEKAVGDLLIKTVSPAQQVIKIVNDEIEALLTSDAQELNLKTQPPAVIMMVGLQGSGKTTSSAKLAIHLASKQKKKVLLASLDIYRPAAQDQLSVLATQSNINCVEVISGEKPQEITKRAIKQAQNGYYDVLILDTAGRLHTDEALMQELKDVKSISSPIETLLVADSLTGQDSVNIATEFNNAIGVTGIVLTRIDGDARGGAALSMKVIANCPVKFMGVGEKLEDFEEFQPKRVASRILGMGDIVSLVEKASEAIDEEEAKKLTDKFQKGTFNLNDLMKQFQSIKKMGGVSKLMGYIPGMGKLKDKVEGSNFAEDKVKQQIAIIQSMTKKERIFPEFINASCKKRIASGSGTKVEDVNKLLKQFQTMQKMMKQFGKMSPSDLERLQRMANVKQF